jgi:hypothetical protein
MNVEAVCLLVSFGHDYAYYNTVVHVWYFTVQPLS